MTQYTEEDYDLTEEEEEEEEDYDLTEEEEEEEDYDLSEEEEEEEDYDLSEEEEEEEEYDLSEEEEEEEEYDLSEEEEEEYTPITPDASQHTLIDEPTPYNAIAPQQDPSQTFASTTTGESLYNTTEDEQPTQSFTDTGFLNLTTEAFHIIPAQEVTIKEIAFSEPTKTIRKNTIAGLTKTIADMGVLNAIHVIQLEPLDEEVLEMLREEGEEIPPQYLLIDGLRRTFAALKSNHNTIPANVWVFKDVELGKKLAFELGVWLNRTQKHSWSETWDTYQLLESRTQLRPAMFEFLFQLGAGDALKLKEVMLGEYDEPKQWLLAEEKSLEQCYKALIKLRKEEDDLEKSDTTSFGDTNEEAQQLTQEGVGNSLTDDEVKELIEMGQDTDLMDVSDADFNEMNEDIVAVQTPGARTRTDPRVRKAVLLRDGFVCQTCGTGGPAFMDVVIVHHKWLVQFGGPDSIDNCITLCDTCHLTLHVIQYNKGRLAMVQSQFDEYPEDQQVRIKRILKLGQYAYSTSQKSGLSTDEIQEIAKAHAYAHRKPGENQAENLSAYLDWKKGSTTVEDQADANARVGDVGRGQARRQERRDETTT